MPCIRSGELWDKLCQLLSTLLGLLVPEAIWALRLEKKRRSWYRRLCFFRMLYRAKSPMLWAEVSLPTTGLSRGPVPTKVLTPFFSCLCQCPLPQHIRPNGGSCVFCWPLGGSCAVVSSGQGKDPRPTYFSVALDSFQWRLPSCDSVLGGHQPSCIPGSYFSLYLKDCKGN